MAISFKEKIAKNCLKNGKTLYFDTQSDNGNINQDEAQKRKGKAKKNKGEHNFQNDSQFS